MEHFRRALVVLTWIIGLMTSCYLFLSVLGTLLFPLSDYTDGEAFFGAFFVFGMVILFTLAVHKIGINWIFKVKKENLKGDNQLSDKDHEKL